MLRTTPTLRSDLLVTFNLVETFIDFRFIFLPRIIFMVTFTNFHYAPHLCTCYLILCAINFTVTVVILNLFLVLLFAFPALLPPVLLRCRRVPSFIIVREGGSSVVAVCSVIIRLPVCPARLAPGSSLARQRGSVRELFPLLSSAFISFGAMVPQPWALCCC